MISLAPLFPLFHHKHEAMPTSHPTATHAHATTYAPTMTHAPRAMHTPAVIHRHPSVRTQTQRIVPIIPLPGQSPETVFWQSVGVQAASFIAVALAATVAYVQWRKKHQATLSIEAARWGPLVIDAYDSARSGSQVFEAQRLVVMAVDRLHGATVLLNIILIALTAVIALTAIFHR